MDVPLTKGFAATSRGMDRWVPTALREGVFLAPMAVLTALLTLALLAVSPAMGAQQAAKVARIGYLSPLTARADAAHRDAFLEGLRALGHVEGQNVVIETRYADGRFERLPDLAADIVRLKVDVIVTAPTPAVRAVQQATRTTPIVMALSGDPVGDGFVATLARPGANITGIRPRWLRWR